MCVQVIKKESIDNVTSKKPSGWFSGWWGSSKKEEESTENVTLSKFSYYIKYVVN